MTKQDVLNKVKGILLRYSDEDLKEDQIGLQTNIISDLKINSARLIDVILDFEEVFNIEIEDETADKITTIGESVEAICRLTGIEEGSKNA